MKRQILTAVMFAGASMIPATGHAQQFCGNAGARSAQVFLPNPKYDGRFTFARISYTESFGGGGFGGRSREPFWHHDYPDADVHFTKLITELTSIRGNPTGSVILSADSKDLPKYPVAYLVEPGHWYPNDQEVTGLRNYLLKGGFLIIDDMADRFNSRDVDNFADQMSRVLPGMKLLDLPVEHPIFDAFYRVKSIDYNHPYYCLKSRFYGIFVDNDPKKRLMVVVNDNNDIGEYWEWSDKGYFAINPSNEAYKLGINYFVYALTR